MEDVVRLTSATLDVSEVSSEVSSDQAGAISVFIGTTRDNFEGKRVVSLEYEAYAPMAERELRRLCSATRAKWPGVCGIAIHHRIGSVPVGQSSVIIAVSSCHRREAIGAHCHLLLVCFRDMF
jgi:molybdopterin synthase catalytic subunit